MLSIGALVVPLQLLAQIAHPALGQRHHAIWPRLPAWTRRKEIFPLAKGVPLLNASAQVGVGFAGLFARVIFKVFRLNA